MKDRTIKNTAKAKADNAKEVTAVREIKVRKQKIPENITYTKTREMIFKIQILFLDQKQETKVIFDGYLLWQLQHFQGFYYYIVRRNIKS